MTGGVGLSARGVNAACGSVLGDAGERAARVGQAQGERKRPRAGEKERMSAAWAVGLAQGEEEAGGWAMRERVGRTGLSCWVEFWVSYWVSIFLFFSTLFLKQTNIV
jgi:hypothetical protein